MQLLGEVLDGQGHSGFSQRRQGIWVKALFLLSSQGLKLCSVPPPLTLLSELHQGTGSVLSS